MTTRDFMSRMKDASITWKSSSLSRASVDVLEEGRVNAGSPSPTLAANFGKSLAQDAVGGGGLSCRTQAWVVTVARFLTRTTGFFHLAVCVDSSCLRRNSSSWANSFCIESCRLSSGPTASGTALRHGSRSRTSDSSRLRSLMAASSSLLSSTGCWSLFNDSDTSVGTVLSLGEATSFWSDGFSFASRGCWFFFPDGVSLSEGEALVFKASSSPIRTDNTFC